MIPDRRSKQDSIILHQCYNCTWLSIHLLGPEGAVSFLPEGPNKGMSISKQDCMSNIISRIHFKNTVHDAKTRKYNRFEYNTFAIFFFFFFLRRNGAFIDQFLVSRVKMVFMS